MDVTIIVTTFGDSEWLAKGDAAATKAAASQNAAVHLFHRDDPVSLGAARNEAARESGAQDWICFLDADDELERGYINAMQAQPLPQWNQLFVPSLRLGKRGPSKLLNKRDIKVMNPCPIGTLIHRDMFDLAEEFWDEPAWEDWSLFRRAVLIGAKLRFVPQAVYRANSTPGGRNASVADSKVLLESIIKSHDEWAWKLSQFNKKEPRK